MKGAVWNVARIALALAGFAVALLALAFDDHRIAWAAIALLAASLLIRLLTRRSASSHSDTE